jgi:protease-4
VVRKKLIVAVVVLLVPVLLACGLVGAGQTLASFRGGGQVGLISIEGAIVSSSGSGFALGGEASDRRVIAELEAAEADRNISAILLYINSPGGSVVASDEIYRALTRMEKPVVAYAGEMAASGGYYVACGADRIVAHPSSIVGSIGVISQVILLEELLDDLGVDIETIKSGDAKDMGSPVRPLTEEERAFLQAIVDQSYQLFVDVIVESRGLSREEVLAVADGRVLSGHDALELGLVDELGGLREAVLAAGELAGISGEPEVVSIGQPPSFLEILLSALWEGNPLEALRPDRGPSLEYRALR